MCWQGTGGDAVARSCDIYEGPCELSSRFMLWTWKGKAVSDCVGAEVLDLGKE